MPLICIEEVLFSTILSFLLPSYHLSCTARSILAPGSLRISPGEWTNHEMVWNLFGCLLLSYIYLFSNACNNVKPLFYPTSNGALAFRLSQSWKASHLLPICSRITYRSSSSSLVASFAISSAGAVQIDLHGTRQAIMRLELSRYPKSKKSRITAVSILMFSI